MQLKNQHFKKCNEWLSERYGPEEIIDWSLVPKKETSTAPLAVVQSSSAVVNYPARVEKVTKPTTATIDTGKLSKPAHEDNEFGEDLDALEALAAAEELSKS